MMNKTAGQQRTKWANAGKSHVVETVFSGALDDTVIQSAWDDFKRLTGKGPIPLWLFVADSVTEVSQPARQVAIEMLRSYRKAGGETVYAVIDGLVTRMIATTVAVATGMRVSFHATRADAIAKITSL